MAEAIDFYRQALAISPENADTHYNLGTALQDVGDVGAAANAYEEALRLNARHVAAYNNLGNVWREQNQYQGAIECYRRALELAPDQAVVHNNLGVALRDDRQTAEAIACFERALSLDPHEAEAHSNLGNALKDEGRLEEAIASYCRALALNPGLTLALDNLGLAQLDQGKLDAAAECFRRSLQLNPHSPHAHWSRGLLLLLQGNLREGWREHEWRWQCPEWRRYTRSFAAAPGPHPIWDGSRLEGKTILLQAEQGLGDTLQFVRFVPLVKEFGGRVVLQCQTALIPLLQNCGADAIIGEHSLLPHFDCRATLLTLPAIWDTTLETVPAAVPYLFADPKLVEHWKTRLSEVRGLRIGINWRGRGGAGMFRRRDIPLDCFTDLVELPGVQLVNLHQGEGQSELEAWPSRSRVFDPSSEVDKTHGAFMDTAAIMQNLDLVITSDTAVAHLAGALGAPTWVGLPFAADWRWLLERSDSPWYPTMRLFRQKQPGDWSGVFDQILAAIRLSGSFARPVVRR